MGFFEDMLSVDYGQTGMDLSPEERRRLIEERMREYQAQVQGYDLSPQLTPLGEGIFGSEEGLGGERLRETGRGKDQAIEKVRAAREAAEYAAETELLQANAMQRSLDPTAWVGGGGPDSGKDFPSDKLWKIRAEAKAKGRAGSLSTGDLPTEQDYTDTAMAGGGSFSYQEPSDALTARLAGRDEWAGGQVERDLAYATTPERARRDPEYAISAAEQLKGLKNARTVEQQVANQTALIEAVKGTGGKVPFELANQLDVAGFDLPWPMRGMSPEQADTWLAQQDQAITDDIEGLMGGGPENVIGWAIYVKSVIATARKRIANGEDRDAVIEWVKKQTQKSGDESGATAYAQQMLAAQEGS